MRLQAVFTEEESEKILKLMDYAENYDLHKMLMDAIDTMYEVILFEQDQELEKNGTSTQVIV